MLQKRDLDFNIGHMNKRITFRTYTRSEDVGAGNDPTVVDYATVWANVISIKDEVRIRQAMKMTGDYKHFIVRYNSNYDKTYKIYYSSRLYNIVDIQDFGNTGRYLKIMGIGNEINA